MAGILMSGLGNVLRAGGSWLLGKVGSYAAKKLFPSVKKIQGIEHKAMGNNDMSTAA